MNLGQHLRCSVDRRSALKGLVGSVLGGSLGYGGSWNTGAATPTASGTGMGERMIGSLSRPRPALPNSYFWTWDHSTNWMLDDPGMLNFGCANRYLKRPETYVEDYRRLTDLAASLGVKGILIWGFLRDAHGGVESAKRVADYAAQRGVAILPGVGTNHYGGIYYEGDHPYNLETFLKSYPDARMIDAQGNPGPRSVCPSHPRFAAWIQEATRWLFREFRIGGANLENGDFLVCCCPRCRKLQAQQPTDEPPFWHHQYLGYAPVLQAIESHLKDKFVTWATYKGFLPVRPGTARGSGACMDCLRPALVDRLPRTAVAQWTLTWMVRRPPLPLARYLDNGVPEEALDNPNWPTGLKPLTARSVGFLHQGSQWASPPRYEQVISTIKEGCLRAYRAGLEGVSIHGEVSSMHVPWALNYLAFSHFIHWPEDSLRLFGSKTLGPVLGSKAEGEAFAETLALWDAGTLTKSHKSDLQKRTKELAAQVANGKSLSRWRFWHWLERMASGVREQNTVSIF